jgi:hypothetical protein
VRLAISRVRLGTRLTRLFSPGTRSSLYYDICAIIMRELDWIGPDCRTRPMRFTLLFKDGDTYNIGWSASAISAFFCYTLVINDLRVKFFVKSHGRDGKRSLRSICKRVRAQARLRPSYVMHWHWATYVFQNQVSNFPIAAISIKCQLGPLVNVNVQALKCRFQWFWWK